MPFSGQQLIDCLLIPGAAGLLLTLGAALLLRRPAMVGPLAATALVAGFLLGYWRLGAGGLVPRFDREYLPYAALLALLPGLVAGSGRFGLAINTLVMLPAAAVAAWLLTPTWAHLEPSRWVIVTVWTACVVLLSAALLAVAPRSAPARQPPTGEDGESPAQPPQPRSLPWLAMMIAALATSAALLALGGSLMFAQTAAAAMAACAGVALGLLPARGGVPIEGVALVYAMLICGVLLTGWVNSFSSIPLVSYLLPPTAPLAYGLVTRLPAERSAGLRHGLLAGGAALAICCLAVALALVAEMGSE